MTSSALIAHVLDPLIDPFFADEDLSLDKAFAGDGLSRDNLRGFKRTGTYALEWAGDKLLIAGKDNSLRLYDPEKDEEERSWSGEWMAMQCDPNHQFLVAAVSWGGKFLILDTREKTRSNFDVDLRKSSQHMKEFLALCWSPDSKHIAVNNNSDQIYLLDLRQPGSLRLGASKNLHPLELNQMAWAKEGDALWVGIGGTPGMLHVYPAPSLQDEGSASMVAHQHASIALAADPEGRYIASGGGDCLVTLWDPRHLVCTRSFGYATQAVTTLGFNYKGNLLAWGTGGSGATGGERNLTIVGTNTGALYWQDSTPSPVQQVKWHPRRNVLAFTVNAAQLPEERSDHMRGDLRDHRRSFTNSRDHGVVHTLRVPE